MSERAASIVVPVALIALTFVVSWCCYEATKQPVPFSHKQ